MNWNRIKGLFGKTSAWIFKEWRKNQGNNRSGQKSVAIFFVGRTCPIRSQRYVWIKTLHNDETVYMYANKSWNNPLSVLITVHSANCTVYKSACQQISVQKSHTINHDNTNNTIWKLFIWRFKYFWAHFLYFFCSSFSLSSFAFCNNLIRHLNIRLISNQKSFQHIYLCWREFSQIHFGTRILDEIWNEFIIEIKRIKFFIA